MKLQSASRSKGDVGFLMTQLLLFVAVTTNMIGSVYGQGRIIGGTPVTTLTDYPFYGIPSNGYLCGATLIHSDIMLSAAHCGNMVWKDGVWVGGTTRISKTNSKYYTTSSVKVHEKFDTNTFANDIMLFKIDGTHPEPYATWNTQLSLPLDGAEMTAIGYGTTSEGGSVSNNLLKVNLLKINATECQKYYGTSTIQDSIMLCNGGYPQGGKDTCQGDSGGPLFINGTTIQVALVSFGDGCARPNTPAVNTRVSAYDSWIKQNICIMSSNKPSYCFPSPTTTSAPVSPPTAAFVPPPTPTQVSPPTAVVVPPPTPTAVTVPPPTPTATVVVPVPTVPAPTPTTSVVAPTRPSCRPRGSSCTAKNECCSKKCARTLRFSLKQVSRKRCV